MTAVLLSGHGSLMRQVFYYWLVICVARTAGTAIGDLLAEDESVNIGLAVSTIVTGIAFVSVLTLWPGRVKAMAKA